MNISSISILFWLISCLLEMKKNKSWRTNVPGFTVCEALYKTLTCSLFNNRTKECQSTKCVMRRTDDLKRGDVAFQDRKTISWTTTTCPKLMQLLRIYLKWLKVFYSSFPNSCPLQPTHFYFQLFMTNMCNFRQDLTYDN